MMEGGSKDSGNKAKLAEESEICEAEEKNIESRFECPICLTWLKDPMLTSCGHKFCSECIAAWLKKEGACCPVDSKPLDPDKDLFEDRYTSREISQQRTNCPYRQLGCDFLSSPVDMERHVQEKHALDCPFKYLGCSDNFPNEEALRRHTESNVHTHLTMAGNALTRLTQSQLEGRAVESKLWDAPPKRSTADQSEEPTLDWQRLLKDLYERIVVLEQQNRELSSTVTNQQTRLSSLQRRFSEDENILRHCHGLYIWRLCSFNEKLQEMSADPLRMYYSPGFYTSPNGYKICARINISRKDPSYLSILLHMMQSDNDDALDWPFDGTISFVLVHPRSPEKTIREKTISMPGLEAFRKPLTDLNKRSFGYTEFVQISELADFFHNNCLVFRIQVKPRDRFDDFDFQQL